MHRLRLLVPGLLVAATTVLLPGAAHADSGSTLTVVGTSDVFDSNLVQAVIKPGFEATHPGVTLNYVSKGTGPAIAYAEAGTASALIVHAASLENQFVAAGYSTETYGRAIFYGDYVLLGPADDPAGVASAAPHDIVGAFERIAAAGAAGKANFVSRGGTPGTTVQEHAIWALTQGQSLCTVSDTNGGGQSPSTTTGPCPSSISYPSWYHATGLSQAPNITAGDTCNFSGGGCYVFTDRGTFDYLQSTHAISNLTIVTRDNAVTARGGPTLLINSFHAYGINPAKFSPSVAAGINATAASAFLNWITSPAAQEAVAHYLAAGGDAPFLPDAAPAITVTTTVPHVLVGGRSLTIKGTLRNVVPDTPPLVGMPVFLYARRTLDKGATAAVVATTTTDATGAFHLAYVPTASSTYKVATGELTQVEDAHLSPIFGDLLSPATLRLGQVDLVGHVSTPRLTVVGGVVTIRASLTPPARRAPASVKVFARRDAGPSTLLGTSNIRSGQKTFTARVILPPGSWTVQLVYRSSGQFTTGRSPLSRVLVP